MHLPDPNGEHAEKLLPLKPASEQDYAWGGDKKKICVHTHSLCLSPTSEGTKAFQNHFLQELVGIYRPRVVINKSKDLRKVPSYLQKRVVLLFQERIKPVQVEKINNQFILGCWQAFIDCSRCCVVSRRPPEVSDVADNSCSHDGRLFLKLFDVAASVIKFSFYFSPLSIVYPMFSKPQAQC